MRNFVIRLLREKYFFFDYANPEKYYINTQTNKQ